MQKYTYLRVSRLVGVDIAATSIKHAQERAQQQRNQVFACSFYAGDCFEVFCLIIDSSLLLLIKIPYRRISMN